MCERGCDENALSVFVAVHRVILDNERYNCEIC